MPLMKMLSQYKMSRAAWGVVLVAAALLALAGAWLLETVGVPASGLRPLPFVGTVVAVKLGLFAFWPWAAARGRSVLALGIAPARPAGPNLWEGRAARLDLALFAANVPTFVLNQEQRLIDWNPAFDLVFGATGLARGAPVTEWYARLDNFRRVAKRTDKLYGEAILPLADRERATFLSKEFGRMVFTKIMAPIVDRSSGRILGWTVALNINSVTKRRVFFDQLHARVAAESRRCRYAAAYDGLFDRYTGRRRLLELHLAPLARLGAAGPARVLELGCGTGAATVALAAAGHRVTAVERDTQLLRRAKDRVALLPGASVRLVRQDPDGLRSLPAARYQAAVMVLGAHRLEEPEAALRSVYAALAPGGVFTVSARLEGGDVATLFARVHAELVAAGAADRLKHQFNHVLDYERDLARGMPLPSRADLRAWLLAAGFALETEHEGLEDGHTLLIVARK